MEKRDTSTVCVISHECWACQYESCKEFTNYASDLSEPEQGAAAKAKIEDSIASPDIHQEDSSLDVVQADDGYHQVICKDQEWYMDLQVVESSIVYEDSYLQEFIENIISTTR